MMAKYNVLVKELTTIETLSCVNVIASDKTGTLTCNIMEFHNFSTIKESYEIGAESNSQKTFPQFDLIKLSFAMQLLSNLFATKICFCQDEFFTNLAAVANLTKDLG